MVSQSSISMQIYECRGIQRVQRVQTGACCRGVYNEWCMVQSDAEFRGCRGMHGVEGCR